MNDEEENEELNEEPASNEPVNVLIKKIVAGKVALYPRSEYSPTTSYEKLNLVSYQGSSYICIKDCVGMVPTNTEYWYLNAQKGDKGDTGDTGQAGHTPKKGVDYFTPQDIADIEKDILESETIEDLETRISLLEGRSTNLTWKQISDIVKAGQAEKYFQVGDQITTTWKDTQTNTEYEAALDVVAFRNVTIEENGVEKEVPRNDITMALLFSIWSTI